MLSRSGSKRSHKQSDMIAGSPFTLLVYDGNNSIRCKKVGPNGEAEDSDEDADTRPTAVDKLLRTSSSNSNSSSSSKGKRAEAPPVARIGCLPPAQGTPHADGVYEFDVQGLPELLYVRGDVKCRILSPWRLPGKKYDDSFMYFWFHTAFLAPLAEAVAGRAKRKSKAMTAAARRASRRRSSFSGDGGEDEVARMGRGDDAGCVILRLDRDHLDNGHHRPNKKVLPPDFAVEIKLRPCSAETGAHHLGPYSRKRFIDPEMDKEDKMRRDAGLPVDDGIDSGAAAGEQAGGASKVEVVVARERDSILAAESPWARKT